MPVELQIGVLGPTVGILDEAVEGENVRSLLTACWRDALSHGKDGKARWQLGRSEGESDAASHPIDDSSRGSWQGPDEVIVKGNYHWFGYRKVQIDRQHRANGLRDQSAGATITSCGELGD
ncbi:MAG: hypothetical protein KDI51_02835 [Xanthomonadales bacterium]|nr:hypothetical protein [Xanthomonadales bacterium]